MAHIQAGTGVARPRRQPLSGEEYRSEVRLGALKGAVAGGLLLTRLQLHLNGYPFSLARALPLVRALLPNWETRYMAGLGPKMQAPVSGLAADAKCSPPTMSIGLYRTYGRP